jgi:UrcA family protein
MNRETSSRMSKHARAALVAVAGCLFAAAVSGNGTAFAAEADSADAAPSLRVNYAGLDLTSDQGARILYQRIAVAAERVCANPGTRDLRALLATRTCERKAMAEAIEQVGNPKVAAILAATTTRS